MTLPKHKVHLTPKHLVGIERDRFYNRLLLFGTFAIVAFVILLVSWGSIRQLFVVPNATVAEVEGTKITGAQFQLRVSLNRSQIINNYIQTYYQYNQMMQLFGSDPTFQQQAVSALTNIAAQLDPQTVGNSTINEMVDDELLKLEAAQLGISVSPEDVDKEIQVFLSYFPNGTPTAIPSSTPFAVSTLSETQQAIVTLTVTPSPFPTSTSTPTGLPTSTSTPTPAQSTTPAPTETPTPTATPYTAEGYQAELANYFSGFQKNLGLSEQDLKDVISMGLLRTAIYNQVTADTPHEEDEVWSRHILVATEDEAIALRERLLVGEDWNTLAAQNSIDTASKDQGGDIGWVNASGVVPEYSAAAFQMQIGEISQPVQSQYGWHIIQVLGHEMRLLTDSGYEQARQLKFQEFITGLRDKYSVTIYPIWSEMVPTQPDIPAEYKIQ
jgi:hypothetical protein